MSIVSPGSTTALGPRDLKRYAVDVEGIPNRGSAAEVAHGLSFPEVAAKVAAEGARDRDTNLPPAPAKAEKHLALWEQEEFGFRDLVDIINPLHHIPIVATLYRHMTGEKIGAVPRVIGGALWGRLGGFVSGLVNAAVDWFTGKDIGDHIYSALFGDPTEKAAVTSVAAAAETVPNTSAPAAPKEHPSVMTQKTAPDTAESTAAAHTDESIPSRHGREPMPVSSIPLLPIPDIAGQALLACYDLGRRRADSDDDPPRLYVRV